MQMNIYNINKIFSILYRERVKDVIIKFTNHAGHLGVIMNFHRNSDASFKASLK